MCKSIIPLTIQKFKTFMKQPANEPRTWITAWTSIMNNASINIPR